VISWLAAGSHAALAQGADRPVSDRGGRGVPAQVERGALNEVTPWVAPAMVSRAAIENTGAEFLEVDGPAPLSEVVVSMMGEGLSAVESILGWDSRLLQQTSMYPNRAIGLITLGRNNAHHCTGWLISPNTVATAGHCVHTGGTNGSWYNRNRMRFWPGRDGTSTPFGSCTVARLHSVRGWTRDANSLYDYGAMRLNCTVGNTTGWFGMFSVSGQNAFRNTPAITAGYPGDRPQTQWLSADMIRVSQSLRVCYRMDTIGGQSGSPVWQDRDAALHATGAWGFAIHAYGNNGACGGTYNNAPRLTAVRINNYINWINL
jgi:glutamyl endopeptidase